MTPTQEHQEEHRYKNNSPSAITTTTPITAAMHSRYTQTGYSGGSLQSWRCQNISLYELEQSLLLSQDEGEQC